MFRGSFFHKKGPSVKALYHCVFVYALTVSIHYKKSKKALERSVKSRHARLEQINKRGPTQGIFYITKTQASALQNSLFATDFRLMIQEITRFRILNNNTQQRVVLHIHSLCFHQTWAIRLHLDHSGSPAIGRATPHPQCILHVYVTLVQPTWRPHLQNAPAAHV